MIPVFCVKPDLDHSWVGTHNEINFGDPNNSLNGSNDGFVRQNDLTEQSTASIPQKTTTRWAFILRPTCRITTVWLRPLQLTTVTIHPSLLKPCRTGYNEFAATSFGHLVTSVNEIPLPPSGGFQPINGTISISWIRTT